MGARRRRRASAVAAARVSTPSAPARQTLLGGSRAASQHLGFADAPLLHAYRCISHSKTDGGDAIGGWPQAAKDAPCARKKHTDGQRGRQSSKSGSFLGHRYFVKSMLRELISVNRHVALIIYTLFFVRLLGLLSSASANLQLLRPIAFWVGPPRPPRSHSSCVRCLGERATVVHQTSPPLHCSLSLAVCR